MIVFALHAQLQYLVNMWKVISFTVLSLIITNLALAQQTEPYKPDAEFEFKFDYSLESGCLTRNQTIRRKIQTKDPPVPALCLTLKQN